MVGTPETAVYTASKGGVSLLTKSLALELAPFLVRVNAVCPADIMTPMLQYQADTYGGGDPEGYFKRLLASYAQGEKARFITPEEVAELIFFLASPAAAPITGANISIDFGTSAGLRLRLMRRAVADQARPRGAGRGRCLLRCARCGAPARCAGPAAAAYRPGDDWRHIESTLAALNTPPAQASRWSTCSAARRPASASPPSRPGARRSPRLAGGSVRALDFGSSSQAFKNDLTIVRAAPAVPSIVLIGLNVGRYTSIPPKTTPAAAAR